MKNLSTIRYLIRMVPIIGISIFFLTACNKKKLQVQQYLSVNINGVPWQAMPAKTNQAYNLSYKTLSHQLSILGIGMDGSRLEISFHAADRLKPGNYPSTINDGGVTSGIFYFPVAPKKGMEMASVTYSEPIQENTVQITKIDRTDKDAYIIEGTFAPLLHALTENNPNRTAQLTDGKFRIVYHPDSLSPGF